MHLLLTDRLTCPRCGPAFGLILRADRMDERRVLEGGLGCANCRELYPVRRGFGDLRPPPRDPAPAPAGAGFEDERGEAEPAALGDTDRARVPPVAELLGAARGAGACLLVGTAARFAPALVEHLEEAEAVAAWSEARAWPEREGVSRIRVGGALPFFDRALRGVVLDGAASPDDALLGEALRVLAPRHGLVVVDPDAGLAERLRAAGLERVVEGPGVLAASR